MKKLIAIIGLFLALGGCSDDTPQFLGPDGGGGDSDSDADSDSDSDADSDSDSDSEEVLPALAASAGALPAADPKLDGFDVWPLAFDLDPGSYGELECTVEVHRGDTAIAKIDGAIADGACAAEWDGLDADGGWVAPGQATATASVAEPGGDPLASADMAIEIVRLGFGEIALNAADGAARVPLLWAETGGEAEGYYEVAADGLPWRLGADSTEGADAVDLELADGAPRALPAPWTDLKSPPLDAASTDGVEHDTYNLPTAFAAGALVDFAAKMSSDVAGAPGGGAPIDAEIRVVAPDGTAITGDDAFAPGASVTARTDETPVPAVGLYTVDHAWRFEARRAGGTWIAVPGAVTTSHRLYGVVAQPTLEYTTIPHRPWIEVVDAVAGWVGGASADPVAVAGDVVAGIYDTFGLSYDTESGASSYTSYTWNNWENGVFDLSGFLRRDKGSIVNCSDCAGILSTYANMVGVDFTYHIIQNGMSGFDLNYIKAIGGTAFDETPFDSGDGSFNYHAVTGPSDGTIYDATLKLDGDGTPTASPFTEIWATDMPEADYLFDLSSEWDSVSVDYSPKVELQVINKVARGLWTAGPGGAATPTRSGVLLGAVAPRGLALLSSSAAPAPEHPAAFVFGDPKTRTPRVVLRALVASDAATARAALRAFAGSSSRGLSAIPDLGDAAYGGGALVGFARDNVLIAYRVLDGSADALTLARAADAAVLAAPVGDPAAAATAETSFGDGRAGDVSRPLPGGAARFATSVALDGPGYARRTGAGWVVVRTGAGPIRARVVGLDEHLRQTR
jgi:hypothetical protein